MLLKITVSTYNCEVYSLGDTSQFCCFSHKYIIVTHVATKFGVD